MILRQQREHGKCISSCGELAHGEAVMGLKLNLTWIVAQGMAIVFTLQTHTSTGHLRTKDMVSSISTGDCGHLLVPGHAVCKAAHSIYNIVHSAMAYASMQLS